MSVGTNIAILGIVMSLNTVTICFALWGVQGEIANLTKELKKISRRP